MGNDACKGERCNRLQQCEDSDEGSEEKEVVDIPLFPGKSVEFLNVTQAPSSPTLGPPKILAPPGVRYRSRRRRQNPIEVAIVRLVVSLDHNDHVSSHGRFRLSDMQHLRPNPADI
eukprot:symbB.v1.2.021017.t1/scaffold1796.1/size101022/2